MSGARVGPAALAATCVVAVWAAAGTRPGPHLARASSAAVQPRLLGFSPDDAVREAAREREFASHLSAAAAEADFDLMTARPHQSGSPHARWLADHVADRFRTLGFDVSRREYHALIPWPGERRLEIIRPDRVRLQVEEETLPDDPWATKPGILPVYNAYSPSGDVTGEVVYANYGVPADYETLAGLGIDVAGKIVLVRYGGSYRGIKPKVAAEHGAIGCLIYSDPRDDGYFQGETFPGGPYRGWGMAQRGSVMDLTRYPGDPMTPGRASTAGAERLPFDRLTTLARIPVQPLSYRDGIEILRRLSGPLAPEAWRGALPVTYRVGPGPAAMRVKLQMEFRQRPVIDVLARVVGSQAPDEWIVLGAHRDAWVYGASDPVSGHVSMMNIAVGVSRLIERGWRPRRTILFASWDGEEPGLIGSTEFVEEDRAELASKVAVYLNRDGNAGGSYFTASAVSSLQPFLQEVARSVESDRPGTLYDRWLERERDQAQKEGRPLPAAPHVGALGSGSDYTPFLSHVGIASADLGLAGAGISGTYHSVYDDPVWFKKYIDPDFKYSVLASRVTGIALLRLVEADVLPLDYAAYGRTIRQYVDEIEQAALSRSVTGTRSVDFPGLKGAADGLARAGEELGRVTAPLLAAAGASPALADLNRRLIAAERDLVEPSGLPDRPWFRHTIYAPGAYTGYAAKTIPGVREAIEAGNFPRAAEQAAVVIRALRRATRTLEGA